jgi:hypothetical protein
MTHAHSTPAATGAGAWDAYYAHRDDKHRVRDMYHLWRKGHSFGAIGRVYGITGDAVAKACQKWGARERAAGFDPHGGHCEY